MTAYAVLGRATAPQKLLVATLSDLLDAHQRTTPDDDFWFAVALDKGSASELVLEWCQDNDVYVDVFLPKANADYPDATVSTGYMEDAVEAVFAAEKDNAVLLALVGEEQPPTSVVRAIARAVDSHMEVRDLAEGGLTYIRFYGDPVEEKQKEDAVPAEEDAVTEDDVINYGTSADEGDEDAATVLAELATEFSIDYEDESFATWSDVAAAIIAAADDAPEEEEEEEPEEEAPGTWTEADLKGMSLKEVREIAKASGLEGAATMSRLNLVRALVAGAEESEEAPKPAVKAKPAAKAKTAPDAASSLGDEIEAIANRVAEILAARLTS